MAQILVRNLEQSLVDHLEERAQRHHRSLQGEVRRILAEAIKLDVGEFRLQSRLLRGHLTGRPFPDLAELITSDRSR